MPLKIGILGAARIARKICRALQMTDAAQVVAVGSRDKSKADAFLAECDLVGAVRSYGSYEAVLDDNEVEAVYIPLPTSTHVYWVQQAASKGKHVMLEKPIALTAADTDAILAACARAGVQLMDGTMWTHSPRTARMEGVLRDRQRLGTIREVTSTFAFTGGPDFLQHDVRVHPGLDGLGCLGDVGWYCVRAILWAFDHEAPTSVVAHGGATFNQEGVPIHVGATLLFSGGRRGNFQCGFDRALTQYLEVAGTQGTLRLDDFVIPRDERRCSFTVTGSHGLREWDTYDGTQSEETQVFLEKPQEVTQWEVFAGCVERIRAGEGPDTRWPRLASLTQKVVCAVMESARQGCREVDVRC